MTGKHQFSICTAIALWVAAMVFATVFGIHQGYTGHAFLATLGILAFFLAIQLFLAAGNFGERASRRTESHGGILLAIVPFFAYLIYLSGTNTFTWTRAGIALAYTLTPVLLVLSAAGTSKPGALADYLAMIAIFLPLKIGWLNRLWPYPGPRFAYILTMLLAISVTLATFLFVRQFDGVGYNIVWGKDALWAVVLYFGLLAVILIPLGTALHFIKFDPAQANWKSLPFDAFSIFLLTAWPEEFLFRGLLQNSLSRTFSSETAGWFSASVVFGLAHITNNGVFPNWRYAILAAIAGIFYGRTWRKTNSIFTSAIVHVLVDTIWHVAFRTL
jgi:membrane protease YdiL (CAAX protease family)